VSKKVLQEGTCWRVGKCENVSIFNHAWLPSFDNCRLSHQVINCNLEYVAELIDNNKREWMKELISNTFNMVDAGRILHLPLAAIPLEDEVIWTERNKYVHEKIKKYSTDIVSFIKKYIAELDRLEQTGLTKAPIKDSWVPPSREDIKINFDVGFNRDYFRSSLGIVARNGKGGVIASKATIHENVNLAFATEAHACLEAVRLGLEMK
ncbi:hypothetical protein J1N35_025386, partial [Gossypium stocksii]